MKIAKDPVHPEKIKLITEMLSDPVINELWLKFVSLGVYGVGYKEREIAFQEYCHFRDLYLGLPPLKIEPIQGTHRKNMV